MSKRNLFHHFSKICLKMALIYWGNFLFLILKKDLLLKRLLLILIYKIFMIKANKLHSMGSYKLLLMKTQNIQLRSIVKLYTERLQNVKKETEKYLKMLNQCRPFRKMNWEEESVRNKRRKNKKSANNNKSNKDFMSKC